MALCTVLRKGLFPIILECKHFSAKSSNQNEDSRKEQLSADRSDDHRSVASFPRYYLREQLHEREQFSYKTAKGNGESVRGGCLARNKGSECSVEVNWLESFPDWLLALTHLLQKNDLAACYNVTKLQLLSPFLAQVT